MAIFQYNRQVWILTAGTFINMLGFSIAFPFISLYLYKYNNISMSSIGFALAVSAIVGGISQLVAGELSDKIGRKILINVGLFLQMVVFILFALAIIINAGYTVFFILLVIREVAGGIYRSIPIIMIADVVPSGKRSSAYSLMQIGTNLGMAIGPAFGGFIAMYSYSMLFLMTSIASGVYLLISILFLYETMHKDETKYADKEYILIFKNKLFLTYCIISTLISLVSAQMLTTFSTFSGAFIHISEIQIGILFSISGFLTVFLQYPVTLYFERYRLTTSLIMGSLLYAIGFFVLGFSYNFWQLIICVIIISVSQLISTPPSLTLVTKMASHDNRGRYVSFFRLLGGSGFAFGPLVGGFLMDAFALHISYMWIIFGTIALAGSLGYIYLRLKIGIIDRPI